MFSMDLRDSPEIPGFEKPWIFLHSMVCKSLETDPIIRPLFPIFKAPPMKITGNQDFSVPGPRDQKYLLGPNNFLPEGRAFARLLTGENKPISWAAVLLAPQELWPNGFYLQWKELRERERERWYHFWRGLAVFGRSGSSGPAGEGGRRRLSQIPDIGFLMWPLNDLHGPILAMILPPYYVGSSRAA